MPGNNSMRSSFYSRCVQGSAVLLKTISAAYEMKKWLQLTCTLCTTLFIILIFFINGWMVSSFHKGWSQYILC